VVAADQVSLTVTALNGAAIADAIPALARLRIAVFKEFPYLYDGSLEYEAAYLQTYLECPQTLVVTVQDGTQTVGATSALPLAFETPELRQPFETQGWDVRHVFYLAESVLLPAYRGRGLGHQFFELREAHARRLGGFTHSAFCAVKREDDHPARAGGPRSLEAFWRGRGYAPDGNLSATLHWQEIGQAAPTPHELGFWLKTLEP
jgi:GNAT superfamily N-acetyltransferase